VHVPVRVAVQEVPHGLGPRRLADEGEDARDLELTAVVQDDPAEHALTSQPGGARDGPGLHALREPLRGGRGPARSSGATSTTLEAIADSSIASRAAHASLPATATALPVYSGPPQLAHSESPRPAHASASATSRRPVR
jgi:hypothetical protein